MPNADVFVALCKIYKCDNPMDIFGTPSISSNEMSMIEKYRELDRHGREMVDFTLQKEWERATAPKNKVKEFQAQYLNAAHEENPTPEQKAAADQVMMNDSEWE